MSAQRNGPKRMTGVTLIELVIVMLVIGILSAIAIPSYRSYVMRVNRADAKVGLTNAAQTLERCFTRENVYNGGLCAAALPLPYNLPMAAPAGSATYVLSGVIAANDYTLTATRTNGQTADAACGDFTLNARGLQGVVGAAKPAMDCWR